MKIKFIFIISMLTLILLSFFSPSAADEFIDPFEYQLWAINTGYPEGSLTPLGWDGINQDYFHSLPWSAGYNSGKIVIGDSRSCQLGIYQERTGRADYAVFAVWGGHYVSGTGTSIMSEMLLSDFELCFHEQIKANGNCTVFFFATVNDYDYLYNNNSGFISAAVSSAEMLASMSYEYEGKIYHPEVIIIGFDGAGENFGISREVFNRYVDSYNRELHDAVSNSVVLKNTASLFTTVPEITEGETTFISDGLHYSDAVLQKINDYINLY